MGCRAEKERGFTLVEFIIGMAAGAAISLVVVFLFAPINNWFFTRERRGAVDETQVAMTRMMKEIVRVKSPSQISVFTATTLTFVDIDNATVSFSLSGQNLLRGADVLAREVQSLAFTYLDKDGVVTATNTSIRVIRINLTIGTGTRRVTLESSARLRNTT